jgi:hypothetical protein
VLDDKGGINPDKAAGSGAGSALAASRLSFDFAQSPPKRIYFSSGVVDAVLQVTAPPVEKFQFVLGSRRIPIKSPCCRVELHGSLSSQVKRPLHTPL